MIPILQWPETITAQSFCRDYWQQRPLLIRRAFEGFSPPLDRHELAQLACEEGADARLICGRYPQNNWQLEFGPFNDDTFASLPECDWTLLVGAVDTWVRAAADLLGQFRFIPDYRIDDLMVSFAAPGGSVGPHTDQYDVFLIQGEGRHRWQIAAAGSQDKVCVPDLPVKVLQRFEPTREWKLDPGDMLYLPPGVPHYGVALQAGMTLSVGFRAPDRSELLGRVCRSLLLQTADGPAAPDPQPLYTDEPACLSDHALAPMLKELKATLQDDRTIRRALAAALSCADGQGPDPVEVPENWAQALREGARLRRSPEVRALYLRQDEQAELFVEGQQFLLPMSLARLLCDSPGSHPPASRKGQRPTLGINELHPWLESPHHADVLAKLIAMGFLEWGESNPGREEP